jgi:SusD family
MKRALRRLVMPVLFTTALQQGCDLSTPPPTGVVLPGDLDGKDGLPTRLAKAIGDFAVAYSGNSFSGGLIEVSGLFADELRETNGASYYRNIDRRDAEISNALSEPLYRTLQRARASAEEAVDAYRTFDPTAVGALYARNLAGFSYVLLAEGFCSGIPFSRAAPDGTVTYGPAETTTQVLERAMAAFDSVLIAAQSVLVNSDSVAVQINLAHVGRGRALLDLQRFTEAGTEVAGVPGDFSWRLEYSDNSLREVNGVYDELWRQQNLSAADSEGVNGIAFLAAGDPRAQVDTVGTQYSPLEYDTPAASIPLAGATEARLIQAEALLNSGDESGSLEMLNALRASTGLPPLADPGTTDGRITQLFRERAFWLWFTGHRLGDLRRLVWQYGRSPDAVYPTGPYGGGPQFYGSQLELPVDEVNNPQYDATSCDPSKP